MTITHDELSGWITMLANGKRIKVPDQLRLATELLNLRAEAHYLKEKLAEALWGAIEMEEKKSAE